MKRNATLRLRQSISKKLNNITSIITGSIKNLWKAAYTSAEKLGYPINKQKLTFIADKKIVHLQNKN